ncbi:MAG: helix-turn-helix domain-containing protein [Candidatus Cloacimonetes bacterium]|nr:helix-turn-helix domain-containing protein [Candidatus Cloacimonadota bacterium]
MNSFGKRIKSIRLSKDMSLRDLSNKSTIHYAILSQYENDLVFPQVKNLIQLSNTLKVNIHWLITGEGPQELPAFINQDNKKTELAACKKERNELRDEINTLKKQHYDDLRYINELQRELLQYKKS